MLRDYFGGYAYTLMQYFTAPDTWFGGFYELAIELGPRSDERLLAALTAVWSDPNLDGAYLDRCMEPWQQARQTVTTESLQIGHLQGLARLPNDVTVACGTCLIREDDGPDWLQWARSRRLMTLAHIPLSPAPKPAGPGVRSLTLGWPKLELQSTTACNTGSR